MSKLIRIMIDKKSITFYGVSENQKGIMHSQPLDGSCDDEKVFDIVCDFWNNGCVLAWDEVEVLRK